ncbi:hypothetical protein HanRHA438_Chr14g0654191 [Helianthus annuus]|nr:hypothetical protein HanRHA438_Chr14g0654191 [Helianthus annuus]
MKWCFPISSDAALPNAGSHKEWPLPLSSRISWMPRTVGNRFWRSHLQVLQCSGNTNSSLVHRSNRINNILFSKA